MSRAIVMILKVLSSFPRLLGLSPPLFKAEAERIFVTTAEAARQPVFYETYGVPDTVEGRFDLLTVHMVSVLERLRGTGEGHEVFSQTVFDVMFSNIDANLRQMGVGDGIVGKRVRVFAEMFYGRAEAYRTALASDDDLELEKALGRNVLGDEDAPGAVPLAHYFRESLKLSEEEAAALRRGEVSFPDPHTEDLP